MAVAGSIVANLATNNRKWNSGFRAAQSPVQRLKQSVARTAQSVSQSLSSIGRRTQFLAASLAAPIGLAVRQFTALDDNLRLLKGITGASAADFAAMSEQVKELGRTTSFTASQVAEGAIALGRAGFATSEILDSLPAILNLSRATGTELAEAADIAGSSLRGFGLAASQTGRVADILTATANGSAQTLTDLFEGLKLVGPVASQVGASIEETSASLGVLANIGIKGSLAGTALRKTFIQLADVKTQEKLKAIGVSATDAAGNFRPLNQILADVARQSANLGQAERLSLFVELFGNRAAGAAAAIGNSVEAVNAFEERLASVNGVAGRVAEEMDGGVGGAFRRFMSSVEGIAIAVAEALEPALTGMAAKMSEVAGRVTAFIGENQDLVVKITAGVAALGAIGVALSAAGVAASVAGAAISGVIGIASAFGAAITAATTAVSAIVAAVGALASPLGIVAGLLAAGVVAWAKWTDAGQSAMTAVRDVFDSFRKDLGLVVQTIGAGGIAEAWELVTAKLNLAWVTATTSIKTAWIRVTSGVKSVAMAMVLNIQIGFEKMVLKIQQSLNKLISVVNKVSLGAVEIKPFDVSDNVARVKLLEQASEDALTGAAENTEARIKAASEPLVAATKRLEAARTAARDAVEKAKSIKPVEPAKTKEKAKTEPPPKPTGFKPVGSQSGQNASGLSAADLDARAKAIKLDLQVPQDAFFEANRVIRELVQSGRLTESEGLQALKKEARKVAEKRGGDARLGAGRAVESRSAEAVTAILNARARQSHEAKIEQIQTQMLEAAREQNIAVSQLNDKIGTAEKVAIIPTLEA